MSARLACGCFLFVAAACRALAAPTPDAERPERAKSDAELARDLEAAVAESSSTKMGAHMSALHARGAISREDVVAAIDALTASELEAFAGGAIAGSVVAEMAAARLALLRAHIEPSAALGGEVAVLLPLSGTHSAIGVELRAAITLAASDAGVSVRFFDTKGTDEGARSAVASAAAEKVGVILGPVGERESLAAATAAVARGIAIGLLAPAEAGAEPSEGVFRLWPSREAEAALAAQIAVELGYDAPAILAPRDELGAADAEAFVAAAKAAGAVSARAGFYDPSATELEPDLKAFLGLVPLENERLRRHLSRYGRKGGWKSFSPDVDFDLLYIPDAYDRAALVASYLPFFNVELRADDIVDTVGLRRKHGGRIPSVVQLLGSHEWHHPSLPARGGSAVDGALIMESCVGGPNEDYLDDDAAELGRRLGQAIGRAPSRLARGGYDAAKLIFDRAKRGQKGRALFAGAQASGGLCGPSRIDAGGQLRREPIVLRVEGDAFVPHEW